MNEYLNKMKQTADQIRLKAAKTLVLPLFWDPAWETCQFMTDRVNFRMKIFQTS